MEITYVIVVVLVTYIFGAITKLFIDVVPNKYIPIQNIVIGFISAFICFFTGVESNLIQGMILCIMASTSAGGMADLMKVTKEN